MGSVAVFVDSLDLRSYDEQGLLLESGPARPVHEQLSIDRNRRSFFEILHHLTHAGFYKRLGNDLPEIPNRWYLPLVSIMHFGAMVNVVRRRLQVRRPKASLISPDSIRQSLILDFSRFFPSAFVEAFKRILDHYREGQVFLKLEPPEFNVLYEETSLGDQEIDDDLLADPDCEGWIPGPPQDPADVRLDGVPPLYAAIQPHSYLQNVVQFGKSSSSAQKRPAGSDDDESDPGSPPPSGPSQTEPPLAEPEQQDHQESGSESEAGAAGPSRRTSKAKKSQGSDKSGEAGTSLRRSKRLKQ